MATTVSHEETIAMVDKFNDFMIQKGAYSRDKSGQIIINNIDIREMMRYKQEWNTLCRNAKKK